MNIRPAPENHGIKFMRADLPGKPVIPARFNRVVDTSMATVVGSNGVVVSTIEHLMACLAGLAIDNALIELSAYEIPVMDGSAGPFAETIMAAGIKDQAAPRHFFRVRKPIVLEADDRFVAAYPDSTFRVTCEIHFDHPVIKQQSCSIEVSDTAFQCEVSCARTFGFLREIELLQNYGLARGGSLDNAIVVDDHTILNSEGLRFEDEFARHKLLDCIGDFSLLGMPLLAHIVTRKSGHAFNHAFLKKFFESRDAWDTLTFL
jgi:UDP-3-O-[3-hydroxymyristoyl] N-acetylglucosamine deacetylase